MPARLRGLPGWRESGALGDKGRLGLGGSNYIGASLSLGFKSGSNSTPAFKTVTAGNANARRFRHVGEAYSGMSVFRVSLSKRISDSEFQILFSKSHFYCENGRISNLNYQNTEKKLLRNK